MPKTAPRIRRRQRGFTLIEAALTTVIVGTGVLAIMAAQQAYHRKNTIAQRSAMGTLLANELRELTLPLPEHDPISGAGTLGPELDEVDVSDFDDLDDFAGTVAGGVGAGTIFDPPINAQREAIPNMDGWTQTITVENVLDDNISSTFTQPLGTTELVRLRVVVQYQGPNDLAPDTISQLSWVVGGE